MATRDTTPEGIARAMVGRDVDLSVGQARETRGAGPAAAAALEVRKLVVRGARVERAVDNVSFSVAPGEILGIAGVEGNGQTELLEAIAGLRGVTSGSVRLGGAEITALGVRARGDAGLSHIPEDRHRRGLVLDYSVADNLILGQQHHFARLGMLDQAAIAAHAARQVAGFDIRPADPTLPARALSGGNQQKVVIAREMSREFTALLAAQPTRGVDVGAIEFIHGELRKARDAGKAVLLVSAELREVLSLSDRIAVMYGGRIVALMPRGEASEELLGQYMTGAAHGAAA
jgi:simple sugar transport system ATP-binding protein